MSNIDLSQKSNIKLPLTWLIGLIVAITPVLGFLAKINAKLDAEWTLRQQMIFSRKLERDNPSLKVPDPMDCCNPASDQRNFASSKGH